MGDDRPAVYREDDRIIFRASALGHCANELALHLAGWDAKSPPDHLLTKFEEGHKYEPLVLTRLMDQLGWELEPGYSQREGELKLGRGCVVRFHPDAVGTPATVKASHVIEVKSLGPDLFDKARKNGVGSIISSYDMQLSVMMHALKRPGVWVAFNKETQELHIEFVTTPPKRMGEIIGKAYDVLGLAAEIERTGTPPVCQLAQYPCAFFYLHPDKTEDDVEVLEGAEADELAHYAAEYDRARAAEKQVKEEKDYARGELLRLTEGKGKVAAGSWRVTRRVQDRTHLSAKALIEAGVALDIVNGATTVTPSTVIDVKGAG